ncbi:unnamed protein product [Notodromas monacha]|uniref:Adenylate cyclase type 9 n=1 Tax=Notodromas monacha TaxID=399045 RepID=A0A7R9BL59_9CRUS|nr:unnamed protein product [Notodromas monacha]CAG0916025.1 unnamed protein product [Notodromas monacha]
MEDDGKDEAWNSVRHREDIDIIDELQYVRIGIPNYQDGQIGSFNYISERNDSASAGSSHGCRCIPFERAAPQWWNPKFDSEILERQYLRTSLPQKRLRVRYALVYLFIITVMWTSYFGFTAAEARTALTIMGLMLSLVWFALFFFTKTRLYSRYIHVVSYFMCFILIVSTLMIFAIYQPGEEMIEEVTTVAAFSFGVVTLLLIYTVIPLPLPACVLICCVYSIIFETLNYSKTTERMAKIVVSRVLLHVALHIIGFHVLIMNEVRSRGTFMIVGQSLLVRRQLEYEAQLKEKMINSVMPPTVAYWLKTEGQLKDDNNKFHRPIAFRPFNMTNMTNVSILFADIVGFTKMSSNKTAEQLVDLLNDLFGRFDKLCATSGCEKIATLGDCYYCVSGCPEPREDHADCCARMGLGMIASIKEFDQDRNEDVNMRVGIHTGTVLCGLVGRKRFKFDVFSNDVTFANKMESTGQPGRVHLSETTKMFLGGKYELEAGPVVNGVDTYFILKDPAAEDVVAAGTRIQIEPPSTHGSSTILDDEPALVPMSTYSTWPRRDNGRTSSSKKRFSNSNPSKDELNVSAYDLLSGKIDVLPPVDQESSDEADDLSPLPTLHQSGGGNHPKQGPIESSSTLNSRKDSGIRSCHSSIPGLASTEESVISEALLMHHRASGGYYTASPVSSTLDLRHNDSVPPMLVVEDVEGCNKRGDHHSMDHLEVQRPLAFYQQLRKQSDLQLIHCVQQDCTHRNYFVEPPLHQISLRFVEEEVESQYRDAVHRDKDAASVNVQTLNSRWLNTRLDISVAICVFAIISTCCFLLFVPPPEWIVIFVAALYYEAFVVALFLRRFVFRRHLRYKFDRLFSAVVEWKWWHTFGAVLIALPIVSVLSNSRNCDDQRYYCYVALVGLVHFLNFTQLNCYMKACMAAVFGIIFVVLLRLGVCPETPSTLLTLSAGNLHSFSIEIWLVLVEVMVFNLLLNREMEIGFRLNFYGGLLADKEQSKMRLIKNQAEWLLHNIIPRHVADKLKTDARYSENHSDVGVVFASIVNFSEMYDESYQGGKEYLRVLNELIGDFDELLLRPEFCNVDKIKTIGSTYMAASGLNVEIRRQNGNPRQHLTELMEFAIQLMRAVREFNKDLLEFNLILRIGFNHGEVTAGVIGTTKLYFDIWGDTVNIASRMDSTGVNGRIQCSEKTKDVMDKFYEFDRRGTVFVKGKNDMNVFLLREPEQE